MLFRSPINPSPHISMAPSTHGPMTPSPHGPISPWPHDPIAPWPHHLIAPLSHQRPGAHDCAQKVLFLCLPYNYFSYPISSEANKRQGVCPTFSPSLGVVAVCCLHTQGRIALKPLEASIKFAIYMPSPVKKEKVCHVWGCTDEKKRLSCFFNASAGWKYHLQG